MSVWNSAARWLRPALAALSLSMLAACASVQREEGEVWDPVETPNRFVFAANQTLDIFILRPITATYRQFTPKPVQRGVTNVLHNLGEPVTAINEVFQGEPARAGETLLRFVVNSTVGILGLFDVAKHLGLPPSKEDFGQTIGVWAKAPPTDGGPYLVLPLLGPSNARDAAGLLVDYLIDPFRIAAVQLDVEYLLYAKAGVSAIDSRSRTMQALDDIEKNSVDFYSAVRSAYTQRRASQIREKGSMASMNGLFDDAPTVIGLAR